MILDATITIPCPCCTAHQEVRKMVDGYWTTKVERINEDACDNPWCIMNTGEWKNSIKYTFIVNRMKELGWEPGIPFGTYWKQAEQEYANVR